MAYDREKYRDKRERVLGVRKRGISFATLAAAVSLFIVIGLGLVVIPKSVAYFHARHLDDAIYKLRENAVWPPGISEKLHDVHGIQDVKLDSDGQRLVVTYNRSKVDAGTIASFFMANSLPAVLLNSVGHSVHKHSMAKEAAGEAL